jgi:hypothetical protein
MLVVCRGQGESVEFYKGVDVSRDRVMWTKIESEALQFRTETTAAYICDKYLIRDAEFVEVGDVRHSS